MTPAVSGGSSRSFIEAEGRRAIGDSRYGCRMAFEGSEDCTTSLYNGASYHRMSLYGAEVLTQRGYLSDERILHQEDLENLLPFVESGGEETKHCRVVKPFFGTVSVRR